MAGLGLNLLERLFFILPVGLSAAGYVFALALTLAFIHGVRGTFAMYRLRGRPEAAQPALGGQPLFR